MEWRVWRSRMPLKYICDVYGYLRKNIAAERAAALAAETRWRNRARLSVEQLENRCVPTSWNPLGPAPEFSPGTVPGVISDQNVAGLVSAVVFSDNYDGKGDRAAYEGTAGGGVWRSTDYWRPAPSWTPLTDFIGFAPGSIIDPNTGRGAGTTNIGALAVDPFHPWIIYAGTGFWRENYGSGVMKSTDGGNTWTLLPSSGTFGVNIFGQQPSYDFFKQAISKIIVDPTDPTGQTLYEAVGARKGNVT